MNSLTGRNAATVQKREALKPTKPYRSLYSRVMGRFRQLTFRPYVINRDIVGERIRFLIGDLFGEGWYGPAHDPWPELEWIKTSGIKPGDVVVDCGANHGFTTVLFSKWTGLNGLVYAFEPSRHNFEILQQNLEMSNISNARCVNAALGAARGKVSITRHPNATVIRQMKKGQEAELVSVTTLDDEITAAKVDFIKIDVEGFELEILKGAKRILSTRPKLALELHVFMYQDKVDSLREIFDLLYLDRYTVELQRHVDGPIEPVDIVSEAVVESLANLEVVHLFCR